MEIRNLVFWDYLLFRKKINLSLRKISGLIKYTFVKVTENNNPLMIWQLDNINDDISYINKVFFIGSTGEALKPIIKDSSINTTKYIYESRKDESNKLESLGFRKDGSNIVLKMNLNDKNRYFKCPCNVSFVKFEKGVHDKLRCDIQNEVFYSKDRIPITIKDIIYEYNKGFFIEDMSIFIKVDNEIIGYGQILLLESKYTIANLGIINKYQGKGYGEILVSYLIFLAYGKKINELYIKVKESNKRAYNLYKKLGFEELFKINVYEIYQ